MPYCSNCGTQVPEGAAHCPNCGQATGARPAATAAGAVGARRTEGTAVASLVLGIAGFLVCPFILHILAIVFGNQAQRKIEGDPSLEGDGMARAGVILGWIGIGLSVVGLLFFLLAIVAGTSGPDFDFGLAPLR